MKVVLTNGCFDLLHAGHIDLLWKAKSLGDWLIVAVNTDESVRKLKGPTRPITPYLQRVAMVNAIKPVDMVMALHETDMVEMLATVQPAIWVKGGDYTMKTLNKAEVKAARQNRVEIKIIPVTFDVSTTKILKALNVGNDTGRATCCHCTPRIAR